MSHGCMMNTKAYKYTRVYCPILCNRVGMKSVQKHYTEQTEKTNKKTGVLQ